MNNDQIDKQILDLLRIPATQRNQEDIAEAINRLAAVANLEISPLAPLQHEQIKLAAIAEFLVTEFGAEYYHATLEMTTHKRDWDKPLSVLIKQGPNNHLAGLGKTAQEVLKDLHRASWDKVST